jgi:hypothetical protein
MQAGGVNAGPWMEASCQVTIGETSMTDHQVVTPDEWVEARKHLLAKEKEFTRLRDQLSQARRDLPWVRVTKQYVFSSSSTISCSVPIGRTVAKAARFGPTILTALCRI